MICILTGGSEFKIRVGGKTFVFEFPNHYGGPAALTKRGNISSVQTKAFLEAASLWDQQGRRINSEGYCVWTPPPKDILQHICGSHYLVIGQELQEDCW